MSTQDEPDAASPQTSAVGRKLRARKNPVERYFFSSLLERFMLRERLKGHEMMAELKFFMG